jgi:hypothetical protein
MFSLFDGSDYLNSGLNSTTKEDCVKAGIDYFYDAYEDENTQIAKSASIDIQETILETSFDVTVQEHDNVLYEF